MRSRLLLAAGLYSAAAYSQTARLGEIEFFGYSGLDIAALRKALPVHEGDQVSQSQKTVNGVRAAVKLVTGLEPTDVASVCCDNKGQSMLYIGLGKSSGSFAYNPAPKSTSSFPESVTKLYDQAEKATMRAVFKGNAGEDDSKGYSLAADPELRSKQLAMRDYALTHGDLILQVLESASDDKQRIVASELLGYAEQSGKQ